MPWAEGWGLTPWGDGGEARIPPTPPEPGIDYIVAYGTTPWVKLPTWPAGIQVGDVLELYEERYNQVSREFTIVGLDKQNFLIQITPELESNANFDFGTGESPPPFARIRVTRTYDFNALKNRLEAWLARRENQQQYLEDLSRQLNFLTGSQNPTAAQVRDFGVQLENLAAWLSQVGQQSFGAGTSPTAQPEDTLEQALLDYRVTPAVNEVDTLLQVYRQRGAQRALDILLECRFQDFFGLNQDGASYAGELMQQLRNLARQQLPVSKYGRPAAGQQAMVAQAPAPDPEYTIDPIDKEQ